MGEREAKDALYDALALAANALGNGRRAEIIDVLTQGERPVEEIANEINQSIANTSQHLRKLDRAGLVTRRRSGNRVLYSTASSRVDNLWATLRDVAADHVAEVQRLAVAYHGDRSTLEAITRDQLQQRLHAGDLVILDIRPTPEFRAGHIPGARSVPPDQIDAVLRQLPREAEVVAYCRGPFCAFADEAVRLLAANGHNARRLEDGFPEWRRAGLPVETADRPAERPATSVQTVGASTAELPEPTGPAGSWITSRAGQ